MDPRTDPDLLRALLQGTLPEEERASLLRRVDVDPVLREDLDRMRMVMDLTAIADMHTPRSQTTFQEIVAAGIHLERTPIRYGWPVWSRVAAGLLVTATVIWAWSLTPRSPRLVRLAAITLDAGTDSDTRPAAPPPPIPEGLVNYQPVAEGRVRWVLDLATGRAYAETAGRPILLFVSLKGCPLCSAMDRGAFSDPAVQVLMQEFVPVRLDLGGLKPEEVRKYVGGGWPYFAVIDGTGNTISRFSGVRDPDDFRVELEGGLSGWTSGDDRVPARWVDIGQAVQRILEGRDVHAAGRPGEAWQSFTFAIDARPGPALARLAETERVRIEWAAAAALASARRLADHDPREASLALEREARRYAGSPFAKDFVAVGEALEETGVFPTLQESAPQGR